MTENTENFELWGYYENVYQEKVGGPFVPHPKWELLARFTNREKGEKYIKKSRLKSVKRFAYGEDKVFKNKSLLCNYQDAELKLEHYIPIDPEI